MRGTGFSYGKRAPCQPRGDQKSRRRSSRRAPSGSGIPPPLGRIADLLRRVLVLAVGTIKAHVHNVLVKTGQKSRDDVILHFWQS